MRLWHWKLIHYLPKSQLLGQWRELNSIFKKQDKHILINYIYVNDNWFDIYDYALLVINEMQNRGYIVNTTNLQNFSNKTAQNILDDLCVINKVEDNYNWYLFPHEHNFEYLTICYWNLREKYLRGQKDFTKLVWNKIETFYKEEYDSYERNKEN